MDAVAESGRNPVNKQQVRDEFEQAGAGRDGGNCLARPNSQARTGTEKFSCSLIS